jgi:hypothetical protein
MGKKIASGFALLIGLVLLAGCAVGGNRADKDSQGSFYGGVTGGWTQP